MASRLIGLLPEVSDEFKQAIRKQGNLLQPLIKAIVSKQQISNIGKLMNLPFKEKSEADIERIYSFLKNQLFFAQLSSKVDPNVFNNLIAQLKFEVFQEGDQIFAYGDIGDKFYIILQGEVSVLIPPSEHTPEEEAAGLEFEETWVLGPNEAFGELALIKDQPRAASVISKTQSIMLTLDKNAYKSILGSFDSQRLSRIAEILHGQPMFAQWALNSLWKLGYYWKEETFNRRQFIYREGDIAENMYIVVTGEFRLTKKFETKSKLSPRNQKADITFSFAPKPVGNQWTEAEILTIGPGDLFGEVEIASEEEVGTRITSCMWSNISSVISIKKDDFFRRVNHSKSWEHFYKVVAQREIIIRHRIQEFESFYKERNKADDMLRPVAEERRPSLRSYQKRSTEFPHRQRSLSPEIEHRIPSNTQHHPSISPNNSPNASNRSINPASYRKKRHDWGVSMSRYVTAIFGYKPGPMVSQTKMLDPEQMMCSRLYHFDKSRADPQYWKNRRFHRSQKSDLTWQQRHPTESKFHMFAKAAPKVESKMLQIDRNASFLSK